MYRQCHPQHDRWWSLPFDGIVFRGGETRPCGIDLAAGCGLADLLLRDLDTTTRTACRAISYTARLPGPYDRRRRGGREIHDPRLTRAVSRYSRHICKNRFAPRRKHLAHSSLA